MQPAIAATSKRCRRFGTATGCRWFKIATVALIDVSDINGVVSDAKSEPVSVMIRKIPSGRYRLYSRKINPKTGKRRNLGTFATRAEAEKRERAVQYFKRRGH